MPCGFSGPCPGGPGIASAEVLPTSFPQGHQPRATSLHLPLLRHDRDYLEKEGKKSLKMCVCQSLLPLFYHLYDENWHVAEVRIPNCLLPW